MELVSIIVLLALIEYFVFGALVGWARGKYNVPAPAISGDPVFERYYRVQANTLEQLMGFIPAIVVYGYYGNPQIAAGLGVVFIIARVVYLLGYVKDPGKRALGFVVGWLATIFMLVAGVVAAARALLA
ncbi:MAG: MAPEG family protein [Pseudohongiellaceae bacterium]|jgi:uncharacterized MAPEG superfamily protein